MDVESMFINSVALLEVQMMCISVKSAKLCYFSLK